MKKIKIVLEVELPTNYVESEVDAVLAETISDIGGHVLNSKEFEEIEE